MVEVRDLLRRSFVAGRLVRLGAHFEEVAGAAVAVHFGDWAGEVGQARRLALIDLSPLPRTGFKGRNTLPWLRAQGLALEPSPNRAFLQGDGTDVLVLGPTEALILGNLHGDEAPIARLDQAWGKEAGCYPVPRRESHFWLAVTGEQAPVMLAKLCAVDLRPRRFGDGAIAQTSVARSNAIVALRTTEDAPLFHLLGDSASAGYAFDCLLDAMAEFGGRPVGLRALHALIGGGRGEVGP